MPTEHLTTKVLARGAHIHSMHAHVCQLAPAEATHLPCPLPCRELQSFTSAVVIRYHSRCCVPLPARSLLPSAVPPLFKPKHQLRAKAPPTRGSFRLPEPQLPSLPEVVKESRPLTATKCCGRQVAHRHQPRHLQTSTDCLLAFLTVPCDGLGPQAASGPAPTTKLSFSAEAASGEGAFQPIGWASRSRRLQFTCK